MKKKLICLASKSMTPQWVTFFCSVPPSYSQVLWRAFWADMMPFKGSQPRRMRCFRNYRDTRTPSGVTHLPRGLEHFPSRNNNHKPFLCVCYMGLGPLIALFLTLEWDSERTWLILASPPAFGAPTAAPPAFGAPAGAAAPGGGGMFSIGAGGSTPKTNMGDRRFAKATRRTRR